MIRCLSALAILAMTSCVSMKKHNDLEIQYAKVQGQLTQTISERDIAARTANFCTEQQVKLTDLLRKFKAK